MTTWTRVTLGVLVAAVAVLAVGVANSWAPDLPVAVVENATRPQMRVLRGPLAGLPDLVLREKVKSPAIIVIGEVTAEPHTEQLRALALEAAE